MDENQSGQMTFPPTNSDFITNAKQAFECTLEEFKNANTSDARGMILEIFVKGTSLAEALIPEAEEKQKYLTTVQQGYNLMLITEAAGTDGLIDPKTLLLVTSREVLAGRMTENDELRILALKGPNAENKNKPRWAFWRR